MYNGTKIINRIGTWSSFKRNLCICRSQHHIAHFKYFPKNPEKQRVIKFFPSILKMIANAHGLSLIHI